MRLLEAQDTLLEIVIELQRLHQRLHALLTTLRLPPLHDQMAEGRLPATAVAEMHATIEFVLAEDLGPAIDYLASVTRVTDDQLQRRFLHDREPWQTPEAPPPPVGAGPGAAPPQPTDRRERR